MIAERALLVAFALMPFAAYAAPATTASPSPAPMTCPKVHRFGIVDPASSVVAAYTPPTAAARRQLDAIAHAGTSELRSEILRHFASDAAGMTNAARSTRETAEAIASVCRERDVAMSSAKALALTRSALQNADESTRYAATIAFRDVFAAIYARKLISNATYRQGIRGFDETATAAAVSPTCAEPNAPAAIVGTPVQAEYPEIARQQGATGTTEIIVTLDAAGNVVALAILKSAGLAALDQSALRAARATIYRAPTVDCSPVPGRYLFVANFPT